MPEKNGAGAGSAATSPKPAGPSFATNDSIGPIFPKVFPDREEFWVYHTLRFVTGAGYAICPRCSFSVPVDVQDLSGKGVPEGKEIFFALYTRGETAKRKQPRSAWIVRCAPFDSRVDALIIPDFLREVDIAKLARVGKALAE